MADNTKIEWCDATWNPITGCSVVSPGCTNCYAMQLAGTRLKHTPSRAGLTKCVNGNHVWTGEVRFNENTIAQPLKWKKPRKIFVCAHGDLFHENVPFHWIMEVFAIMALCPQHTFIVLTKRAERMRYDVNKLSLSLYLPNVWLGVSVENQETANARIPVLLDTPAAVRFISAEPLLGEVDLTNICFEKDVGFENWGSAIFDCDDDQDPNEPLTYLDWVIVGGESGKNARPMHPDWVRKIRDDCAAANVPFFFKQWGEWASIEQYDPSSDSLYYWDDYRYGELRPIKSRVIDFSGNTHKTADLAQKAHAPSAYLHRCGKKTAGNTIDGVQHLKFPRGAK